MTIRHTKNTISYIRYHLVFCPRYRRKIFDIPGLKERFIELTTDEYKKHDIEIISLKCNTDYVYMVISVVPSQDLASIMRIIKGATSVKLREEFSEPHAMTSLWTRHYFVSTSDTLNDETINWYVNTQKKRPD